MACSGGGIEKFHAGWAMRIFGATKKAHYFTSISGLWAVSHCGGVGTATTYERNGSTHPYLYDPGDYPRCKRCERHLPD
jgi:hypothetical protein